MLEKWQRIWRWIVKGVRLRMRIVSRIAKRGMDPVVLEGVPIDSTMVVGERSKGATTRVD
jgi:hypothetical protein